MYPIGIINSYYSNLNYHYIEFNITPVEIGSSSFYELYFSKDKSLISDDCSKIDFSLNNKPISSLNSFGEMYTDLNFTYDLKGDGKNENGYVFIKSNYVDETLYTYFFRTVEATINYRNESDGQDESDESKEENEKISTITWVFLYSIVAACVIAIFVVIYVLYKQGICKRSKNDDTPQSISLMKETINE